MDTVGVALIMGLITTAMFVIVLARIDIRKFIGYPILLDMLGHTLFVTLYMGTLTGMVCAAIAGLTLSASIYILRKSLGYKRYKLKHGWIYYPPR